ncbi:uncharacterized protein E0L32_003149 [Thyridium curvatum]|uniref:Uncharacterized protein n=1 Tax=Thyridium curvatum TaxID=1093900 RepID=A0A507BDW5_9PEZI|nr:uncharacterized protein E0L32_003149 [Thyridium curvatum]TPX17506.1 hypothetical protein E0L32_003149 [Thyridium curvatum]
MLHDHARQGRHPERVRVGRHDAAPDGHAPPAAAHGPHLGQEHGRVDVHPAPGLREQPRLAPVGLVGDKQAAARGHRRARPPAAAAAAAAGVHVVAQLRRVLGRGPGQVQHGDGRAAAPLGPRDAAEDGGADEQVRVRGLAAVAAVAAGRVVDGAVARVLVERRPRRQRLRRQLRLLRGRGRRAEHQGGGGGGGGGPGSRQQKREQEQEDPVGASCGCLEARAGGHG